MLDALSQRARVALLGSFATVAAFFVFGGASGRGREGDPLDTVPRASFLVATANLAELRRLPLHDVLFGDGAPTKASVLRPKALGLGELAGACGFDPLSRVAALAVAVPEEGDKGELGVAARVEVTSEELSRCTAHLADWRGGKVETRDVGSFAVVEDPSADAVARPRIAYGHGGLLVVGRGAWFDAMLSAADGKAPGVREAEAHVAMRASLTGRDGWRSPTVLVTALLPRSLRDRIKDEMGAELSDGEDEASRRVMAGVLGVSSVGLALRAGGSGQSVDAAIELVCDAEEACVAVEKLIGKKRLEWSKELMLRMVGLGPLLDSVAVERAGARIRVTAGAPADALAATLERVLRFSSRGRGRPPPVVHGGPSAPDVRGGSPRDAGRETLAAPRPSGSGVTDAGARRRPDASPPAHP